MKYPIWFWLSSLFCSLQKVFHSALTLLDDSGLNEMLFESSDTDDDDSVVKARLPGGHSQILRLHAGLKDYGSATLHCKI